MQISDGYYNPSRYKDVGGFYIGNRNLRKAIKKYVNPCLTLCEVDVFNEIKEQQYINAHSVIDKLSYVKTSAQNLADELGYTVRAVQRALERLIKKDLVRVVIKGRGKGAHSYSLNHEYILYLLQRYEKERKSS